MHAPGGVVRTGRWLTGGAGLLVCLLTIAGSCGHGRAGAEPAGVPAGLCQDLVKRLDAMTAKQVALITASPESARVWSRCTVTLTDDIVAGQKCISDVCAEVDQQGLVERNPASLSASLYERMSTCTRTTIDLMRISGWSDLLTTSYSKICPRIERPVAAP
jgi:hypothetical protein